MVLSNNLCMNIQYGNHESGFQEKHYEKLESERKGTETPAQFFFLNIWYSIIIAWAEKDERLKTNKNNLIKCNSHRFNEFKLLTCETFLRH